MLAASFKQVWHLPDLPTKARGIGHVEGFLHRHDCILIKSDPPKLLWSLAGCSPIVAPQSALANEAAYEAPVRSDSCGEHTLFHSHLRATNWSQQHRSRDQSGNGTCQRAAKARSTGCEPKSQSTRLQTIWKDLSSLSNVGRTISRP